MLGPISEF